MNNLQTFFNQHKPKSTPGIFDLALNQIDRHVERRPSMVALDLCCGAGGLTAQLATRDYRSIGADVSSQFIGHESKNTAQFVVADLNQGLPFRNSSADLVCCIDSLQYFVDLERTLGEMARVLRPGGYLVASGQNDYNPVGLKRRAIKKITGRDWSPWLLHPIENHLTFPRLMHGLRQAGLKVEYVRGLQFVTAWVGLLPDAIRNRSPWPNKPWRSPASLAQRIRFPASVEESALARLAMIVLVCARKT